MPNRRNPALAALQGLFSQGIPAYAAYKMEQKAEQKRIKEKEKEWKQKEQKMQLDFYTAMTKDADPTVRGMAVGKIEELLGTMPYSAVVGQERLRLPGMPQRGMPAPARMPMGPMAGGVMTARQPSLGEIISGAEPTREPEMTAYQQASIDIRNEHLKMTREKGQRAADMNLINNYYSKEADEFIMPYEVAKIIEPQVKEASMRQFKRFAPRLPEEKRPTIFRKDLPERLGTMQLGMPKTKKAERVRVQSPDGTIGTIPANQLEEALRSGYKKVR